jgi:hypothetical protein
MQFLFVLKQTLKLSLYFKLKFRAIPSRILYFEHYWIQMKHYYSELFKFYCTRFIYLSFVSVFNNSTRFFMTKNFSLRFFAPLREWTLLQLKTFFWTFWYPTENSSKALIVLYCTYSDNPDWGQFQLTARKRSI